MRADYINSENEVVSIWEIEDGAFKGQHVLVIHDDAPPLGTLTKAPMLLDKGTRDWLRARLDELDA